MSLRNSWGGDRVTYLEEYFTGILDGKIVACQKMKRAADMILEQYYDPEEYHFDEGIANRHIEFIERFCKQPSGKIGQPLKLELFQKAQLQTMFGFVDDNGLRQYNEVLILEARKNGKTSLTAAIELDMLLNDKEGAPQIYNLATMLDQARLGFNAAHKMVKQSPLLSKHIRKRVSDLYFAPNMGFIRALASQSNGLDGLDTHCAVIDELSAIKNRDLYDLIKQSMGARSQPLLFTISTNGFVRDGIFDAQYNYAADILDGRVINKKFLPLIYELDDPSEWDKEECWEKANPGIDVIKSREYLREMVQKAKDDITFKPTVLVKDFNLKQNTAAAWLTWDELNNEEKIPKGASFRYGIGGLDAADSIDLNAAKVICRRRLPDGELDPKIYVKSMYWLPQRVLDDFENAGKRQGRDNVPYFIWKAQGLLRTVDTYKVDKKVILDWFEEIRDQDDIYIFAIGYDPWHIDDSLLREFRDRFGPDCMVPVRQGVATLSQPMKDLKAELGAHNIIYDNNPIDKWCLANTAVKTDVNGNIQPVKGMDSRKRIDGTMALLDAYVVYCNQTDTYLSLI